MVKCERGVATRRGEKYRKDKQRYLQAAFIEMLDEISIELSVGFTKQLEETQRTFREERFCCWYLQGLIGR